MMTRPNETRARSAQVGARQIDRRGIQIGPRIRVGGSLGKVGQQVKIGAGKVLSNKPVDSALALIPGVGPGVSAAANAAGHILDTSKGGIHTLGDVGKMGLDAGEAYLGGRAANGLRDGIGAVARGKGIVGGVKQAGNTFLGRKVVGAPVAQSGSTAEDDFYKDIDANDPYSQANSQGGGDFLSTAKKVVGAGANAFTGGRTDRGGSSLIDKLLLGGTVATSAYDQKRKNDLENRAIDYSTKSYDVRAPLRAQGLAQLQDHSTPDLSDIFADTGNPYARPRSPVLGDNVPVKKASALSY